MYNLTYYVRCSPYYVASTHTFYQQSSKCPICRAPFHSVLRLRVAKRAEDLTNEELEQDAVS